MERETRNLRTGKSDGGLFDRIAEISNFALSSAFGHRDRIARLGDIDSDESWSTILHGYYMVDRMDPMAAP